MIEKIIIIIITDVITSRVNIIKSIARNQSIIIAGSTKRKTSLIPQRDLSLLNPAKRGVEEGISIAGLMKKERIFQNKKTLLHQECRYHLLKRWLLNLSQRPTFFLLI
jgi:hypothetical protein